MTHGSNLTERLRKWQGQHSELRVCRLESVVTTVLSDCADAADRIEELEAVLLSVQQLLDDVYGYHYAQDPGLRDDCERRILTSLDAVSKHCEVASQK